jgi:hypothetical protein
METVQNLGGQWTSPVEWREADAAGNRAAGHHDIHLALFSPQVLDGLSMKGRADRRAVMRLPISAAMVSPPDCAASSRRRRRFT